MKTLSWILKFIVFPLLPFLFGASVRCLRRGAFAPDTLNPAELAFSMAILTLVISVSTSRLGDQSLRDALTRVFHLGAIVYLALFSWALFLETDINSTRLAALNAIELKVAGSQAVTKADVSLPCQTYEQILARLRWITIVLSLIVVPAAILTSSKYKLENP